jgi:hypothetical protein
VTAALPPERDTAEVDALVADRYLDALLAAGDRRADDAPADAALDPDLRAAARVLRRSLVRVHPSFRFEERLADRLAELGAASAAASATGSIVPFPGGAGPARPAALHEDPLLGAILRGELDPADMEATDRAAAGIDRRPFLVGGAAITSAAISLAGVAYVAWRASRPGGRSGAGLMGRAARTAHARRAAGLVLGGPA